MRRAKWFSVGLALAGMASDASAATAPTPAPVPGADAYKVLGQVAVLHHGRIKPLDTAAREDVKHIYGRESVKAIDPATGHVVEVWPAVAAVFDWSVRPEFWDDQPILLVEYLPLKRVLLADAVKARLDAIAAKPTTPGAARARMVELAASGDVGAEPLKALALDAALDAGDRKALEELAAKLGEDRKHLTPREVESATVTVGGKRAPIAAWFADIGRRNMASEERIDPGPKVSELEKKALEAGVRLRQLRAIQGEKSIFNAPAPVDTYVPRPSDPATLKFTTAAINKLREGGRAAQDNLTPLEEESLKALQTYQEDVRVEERHDPGTNAEFDARFVEFLRQTADWLSLKLLLAADAEESTRFGYPARELERLRVASREARDAEAEAPGRLPLAKAESFVAALRAVGESAEGNYPTTAQVGREVRFNAFAPFFKAPYGYGAALILLVLSLGITADRRSLMGMGSQGLYLAGMAAFLGGIGLEVAGFVFRVRITGWAPVTNMYETVIWVALVTSVIGLVMELLTRRGYSAAAASGVALLCTTLAATSPSLLDPDIHVLNPVLRSNYWLTIHVLTIVSSYAAFALAMGLGQIAVGVYLTATYRRAVGYLELARPLLPGLPIAVIGAYGLSLSQPHETGMAWASTQWFYYLTATVFGAGGILTIMGVVSVLGEVVSRAPLRGLTAGLPVLTLGVLGLVIAPLLGLRTADVSAVAFASTVVAVLGAFTTGLGLAALLGQGTTRPLAVAEAMSELPEPAMAPATATATLAKPTLAEIRARAAASRPKLDPRGLAMQRTAARIKPLSNFIYRAMQVGVLLVAAGTILGGVWADYSWGRFWGWDAKEVWALITLLVYLVPLHGRFAGWVNTFGLVVSSVVCFLAVLMAWYGVNFVLGVGLHSYGFVEGGAQGSVVATTIAVMAVAAAAAWRRKLASSEVA